MIAVILGREIGTCSGWDQVDTFSMIYHNFIPRAGVPFEATDGLFIDFERGIVQANDKEPFDLTSPQLAAILQQFPKAKF